MSTRPSVLRLIARASNSVCSVSRPCRRKRAGSRPNGMTPVRNVAQFTTGPYRVPAIELRAHAFVTNKTPSGTYRGPGRFEGCFFMERLLDLAARDLAVDRIAIRRRNLITLAEMP